MMFRDAQLEEIRPTETLQNPPADLKYGEGWVICDPQDMKMQIIEETRKYLGEVELPKDAPLSVENSGGGSIQVVGKGVTKGCGEKKDICTRITVLAGSPLYIALKLKRYDEAEKILEEYPRTADPGYAALPVEVHFRNDKEEPEVKFLYEKGIYLEDLVLLDKKMPEGLFLKLFEKLIQRAERNEMDRPGRYGCRTFTMDESSIVPAADNKRVFISSYCPPFFSAQIIELPMWCDMRKELNPGVLKDEDRLQDLELFWRSLEGMPGWIMDLALP